MSTHVKTALLTYTPTLVVLHLCPSSIFSKSTAAGCLLTRTGKFVLCSSITTSNRQAALAACFSFNSLVDTPCCFQAEGRSSSSLSNLVLDRPSVSLSNLVLFCGLAIIIFIYNIGSRDVHDAEDPYEHEDREGYVAGHLHTLPLIFDEKLSNMLLTRMSQKNGIEVCKLIYGPSGPFGYYGTLSDDSDNAQVRFLRYPQQEGQRSRCSAKHTKS